MGGDIISTDESSSDQNLPENPLSSLTFLSGDDHPGSKVENGEVGLGSTDLEEFVRASSNIMDEVNQKRPRNVYMDVLKSYDELKFHKDYLKEAKNKILRRFGSIHFKEGSTISEARLESRDFQKEIISQLGK